MINYLIIAIIGLFSSSIVFLTSYFILKQYLTNEQKKHVLELTLKNREIITPLQLQAYERMVLLLERINPTNLIMRVSDPDMSAQQFQMALISTIRQEFDHNLSQQLYISTRAWEIVKNAKEGTIQLVNSSAMQLNPEATATDLAKTIFEQFVQQESSSLVSALEFIKKEFRSMA